MVKPTIHICYDFADGPYGGGNQFLKSLRKYLKERGVYVADAADADVVLFNSYPTDNEQLFSRLKALKQTGTLVIHRVDGPIQGLRGTPGFLDDAIYTANKYLADGTIYQSDWSRSAHRDLGMPESPFDRTILNAPDPTLFHREGHNPLSEERIRIIATSWSGNVRKGFPTYAYLDTHLDFSRYDMTFVGNSPIEFDNVTHRDPVPPKEVGNLLREHDVFITASKKDTCSNSLIEALHCGLPAVVRDDGGHPEIVGDGGITFEDKSQVPDALNELVANYHDYRDRIDLPTIEEVGAAYYDLAADIYEAQKRGEYMPKPLSGLRGYRFHGIIWGRILRWKVARKVRTKLGNK